MRNVRGAIIPRRGRVREAPVSRVPGLGGGSVERLMRERDRTRGVGCEILCARRTLVWKRSWSISCSIRVSLWFREKYTQRGVKCKVNAKRGIGWLWVTNRVFVGAAISDFGGWKVYVKNPCISAINVSEYFCRKIRPSCAISTQENYGWGKTLESCKCPSKDKGVRFQVV